MRQAVVDFIRLWAEKTSFTREQILVRLGIPLLQASTDRAPFPLLQQFYGEARR